jgi:hypothetical protein
MEKTALGPTDGASDKPKRTMHKGHDVVTTTESLLGEDPPPLEHRTQHATLHRNVHRKWTFGWLCCLAARTRTYASPRAAELILGVGFCSVTLESGLLNERTSSQRCEIKERENLNSEPILMGATRT